MLSTGYLKDLQMLPDDFPNWVSRASHLASPKTLPKTHLRDSPCSAVVASERHKQANGDGIPIAIAPKAPRSPVILSSPPSVWSHFKTNDSVRNCPGDEARNCQGDDHYYILDSVTVSPKPVPIIIVTGIIRIRSSSSSSFLLHEC
ncbi:unnamed protein product [Sphagnum troendelagicum]|uniref:Uncharacterized protein n=1 Tax=Sphagnum troendelagicum TaxID=128251 RepID=A0ABP0T9M1_9BRYO